MNSYVVSVNLRSTWVIANSKNGVSTVTDDIIKEFSKGEGNTVIILSKGFNHVKFLLFGNQEITSEYACNTCKSVAENLADEDITVSVEAVDKEALQDCVNDIYIRLSDAEKDFLKENFEISGGQASARDELLKGLGLAKTEEKGRKKEVSVPDTFIGFEPLKQWVSETCKILDKFRDKAEGTRIFEKMAYLVATNTGNGLSAIIKTIADVYDKYNLLDTKNIEIREKVLRYTVPDSRNMLESHSLSDIIELISRGFVGVMSVDISEWMDHLDDRRIDVLLDVAKKTHGRIVFVFTVPYVEQSVFERVKARIDDVILTKTMQFVPPTDEQYFSLFKGIIEKNGIAVNEDVFPVFVQKIVGERNDGKFYSFNTVSKIADELLYEIIVDAAKNDTEIPAQIGIKDVEKLYKFEQTDEKCGLDKLMGMVALKEVKDKVAEILATLKMQKQLQKEGKEEFRPCYHMMFTGNPGTGKTVVARIIGRIFKEEGLLPIGNFYEVSRQDFVGQYVGHTAPKTMELCRNAYGSVLFIDEAYMLADEHDSFSKEAIGTLIAEMENNRDKMVVIFAGYEKELSELFGLNPGLRDRVPHIINFPNYTRDELKEIFFMKMSDKLGYDESFKAAAESYFSQLPDSVISDKEFSNGRFVRNLVERIISKSALRFDMNNRQGGEFVLNENDFKLAVITSDEKELSAKKEKLRRIGF